MMQLITLHLPPAYLGWLDELVRRGYYPNRAEAIRIFIRDGLISEMPKDILPKHREAKI